jgi:hypothetical protein
MLFRSSAAGEIDPNIWCYSQLGLVEAAARLDVLVEVLVDAVDEDRDRDLDGAEPRHEVPVGVVRAALQVARRKVEQADEVVHHAAQVAVGDEAGEARAHLEAVRPVEALQRRERDGREPDLRPPQRRTGVELDGLLAEDLVADRLVEQLVVRQAGDATPLRQHALGLEQKRLAEALRAHHDELLAAGAQELLDLRRPVQDRRVEVLGDANVVGVYGPGAHRDRKALGGAGGGVNRARTGGDRPLCRRRHVKHSDHLGHPTPANPLHGGDP